MTKKIREEFHENDIPFDVKFKGKNYQMKVNNKDCIMLSQLYSVYQFQDGDAIKITMNKNNFELTVK